MLLKMHGSNLMTLVSQNFFIHVTSKYLHFQRNPIMNLQMFATVHSLSNYTNLIDSCQAHLPAQHASNIELICQKWHWCCDWQRATPSRTCKTSLLFAPMAVRVQAGCPAFPFYTPTKPLKRLYFKYKINSQSKNVLFYILDIYNKM